MAKRRNPVIPQGYANDVSLETIEDALIQGVQRQQAAERSMPVVTPQAMELGNAVEEVVGDDAMIGGKLTQRRSGGKKTTIKKSGKR